MTGDCGERRRIEYQVFEKIAATSSGQIYSLNKTDVDKVIICKVYASFKVEVIYHFLMISSQTLGGL